MGGRGRASAPCAVNQIRQVIISARLRAARFASIIHYFRRSCVNLISGLTGTSMISTYRPTPGPITDRQRPGPERLHNLIHYQDRAHPYTQSINIKRVTIITYTDIHWIIVVLGINCEQVGKTTNINKYNQTLTETR